MQIRAWVPVTLIVTLTAGVLHAAPPAGSGERAYTLGDYQNAAQFWQKELDQAASNPEKWGPTALKLGKLQLKLGNIAQAEKLLAEFRRRYPAQSPGTLPGEIMIARGQLTEAGKYLKSLLNSKQPPESRRETLFALGELALQQHDPEAEKYFRQISNQNEVPELWRTRALGGEIYAIINAGRLPEAAKLIQDEKKRHPRYFQQLELLLKGSQKDPEPCRQMWHQMQGEFPPEPEPLIAEALSRGAAAARRAGKLAVAVELLDAAYNYADSDLLRQQLLRTKLQIQTQSDPAGAVKSCDNFIKYFADAPDAFKIRMLRGNLLLRQKLYPSAQESFARLISVPGIAEADRVTAAQAAAYAAEKAGDFPAVKAMYDYALSHSPAERRSGIQFAMIDFYLRRHNYTAVMEICDNLLKTPGVDQDRANYKLLQALMAEKLLLKAIPVAEQLAQSSHKNYSAFGAFRRAQIAEELRQLPQARQLYLNFIKQHRDDPLVSEAKLAAAAIAAEQGENQLAAEEFSAFAESYPQHSKAPGALCMALRSMALQGDVVGVHQQHLELSKRFPKSREYAVASLLRAEFLFERGRVKEANEIAEKLIADSARGQQEIAAGAQYLKARIALKKGLYSQAIAELKSLLTTYPAAGVVAEAALTAGNCAAQINDYPAAEQFYRRAAELRPGGIFATIALGRVGDMLLAQYSSRAIPEKLQEALKIFQQLSEIKKFPPLSLQAQYKKGICQEYSGRDQLALNCYEQLLYLAGVYKSQGAPGAPEWCTRAVYAGLRLIGNSTLTDSAQRAVRLLHLYRELQLPGSQEEIEQLQKEIKKRYNYSPVKE